MTHAIQSITKRLSLREPQKRSLEILHRVMELAKPSKAADVEAALVAIQSEYPDVESFEREFINLCFALATGVGKTRLMGAFIAYLHGVHGIRNFFVLAPNLTIYDKLVQDFTPNTPKYVFQGISEFAIKAPTLVTGDNFEQKPQVLELFERDDVVINIFNIAKFNTRTDDSRKIRRLSEFLGQSYFEYLASLDDLVLIMDEAHRYRAATSMKSIEELKPILGLELTATPQVESGSRTGRFKNVIYDYPLAQAMKDGFVKEPAVATRLNFQVGGMSEAALELMKLEDGIRVHQSTKVDLEVYATKHGVRRVKPFMLVVAKDTGHASELVKRIENESFFDGYYKGRVIEIHSGQKGEEKDANIENLLAVEQTDNPTEIVVHVNMLKEGWDVTNLYTIVPLRAADSRTLVEQSIGRGLRLPYGKRTGDLAVDRLTIIAHDKFQEIVDEANVGGYSFSVTHVDDIPPAGKETIVFRDPVGTCLGFWPEEPAPIEPGETKPTSSAALAIPKAKPRFETEDDQVLAGAALEITRRLARDARQVAGPAALMSDEVQERIVEKLLEEAAGPQLGMYPTASEERARAIVREVTTVYVAKTIAIPRVQVVPSGEVRTGFHVFELDMSSLRLQPVAKEIKVQHLVTKAEQVIGGGEGGHQEARLEDYVVAGIIDYDDVDYFTQGDLVYSLAGQVVSHLRSYLEDDEKVRNVLVHYQRQIAKLVHEQMLNHFWEEATSYEVIVSDGFSEAGTQAFWMPKDEKLRPFDVPVSTKADIRNMLFGGFAKCLYPAQKFDSDSERRFAVLLERDATVIKWFKPGKGVFRIHYRNNQEYEPDFTVETETEKLICEVKRAGEMQDEAVLAKAKAAALWCERATAHELANRGKPWRYVLIPHDVIAENMTVSGLCKVYEWKVETREQESFCGF